MVELAVWLVKLPFVLVAVVLALALGLVGAILSMLGVALNPKQTPLELAQRGSAKPSPRTEPDL